MKICDVCGAKPEAEKPVRTHQLFLGIVHCGDGLPMALTVELCDKCAESVAVVIQSVLKREFNLRIPQ